MRPQVDYAKIALTLLLAVLSLGMAILSSIGVCYALSIRSLSVEFWFCFLPMIGFCVGFLAALRSAWRQWNCPAVRRDARLTPVEAVTVLKSNDFDISRVTGAAWLLGICSLSVAITVMLMVMVDSPDLLSPEQEKRIGALVLLGAGAVFAAGYAGLSALGVPLILKEDPEDSEQER